MLFITRIYLPTIKRLLVIFLHELFFICRKMDAYIGRRVSLDCGGLGFYQGTITKMEEGAITIRDAFHDGKAVTQFKEVTLE